VDVVLLSRGLKDLCLVGTLQSLGMTAPNCHSEPAAEEFKEQYRRVALLQAASKRSAAISAVL
jgi:hypothetical protein